RLLTLRGTAREQCSEEEAQRLHRAGYNALLAPVAAETAKLWDLSDRFGFLMVGQITSKDQLALAWTLAGHPSFLGWLLAPSFFPEPGFAQDPALATAVLPGYTPSERSLVGVEVKQLPAPDSLPPGISFIVCPEELAPALKEISGSGAPQIILER